MRLSFPQWVPLNVIKVLANHSVDFCMQNDDLPNVENRAEIAKNKQIKVYYLHYHLNYQEAIVPLKTSI